MPRFDEVVALGRKLVDELGEGPRPDTLSRWMAQYLAELIDAAENAPQDELAASRRKCFDAVLELWSHRAELPPGRRPFEDLEPIGRALESLDPGNETPRFFAAARHGITHAEEGPQTRTLLEFVDSVDSAARVIIVHALADAASTAVDKSKEWVAQAEAAGRNPRFVGIVISFVSEEGRQDEEAEQVERSRKLLVDRIKQLDDFRKLATLVSDDLRKRLDALPPESDSTGDGMDPGGGVTDDQGRASRADRER